MDAVASLSLSTLWTLHLGSYVIDVLTFYLLLCYRPFGIQFHVEKSLFNVYFAKLDKGTVKPVRWGVGDAQLDQVKSFGVKKFEDFTWKHILDFYTCADCAGAPTIDRQTPSVARCRPSSSASRSAANRSVERKRKCAKALRGRAEGRHSKC